MRLLFQLLVVALSATACTPAPRKPETASSPAPASDSAVLAVYDAQASADSLRTLPVFDSALAWALRQPAARFHHQYSSITPDSLWSVDVALLQGPLLVAGKTHLQVTVHTPGAVEVRFYERHKNRLRFLLKAGTEDPVSDTLRDVNGDGVNDFLLSDYSSAGCCPREQWHVWCFQPATGGFSAEQQFFNATFFPAQKLVRAFGYGHPGEVPVATLRWRGVTADTIEYLVPLPGQPGFFDQHTRKAASQSYSVTKRKGVPAYYRSMKGLDWVMDSLGD